MDTLRPTVERVAVITDIHANLPALEAVLEAIEWTGVDAVYCGGDLVGYGPHPNEVCALIEERGIPTIYGNYDYAIARDLEDCGCAYRDQHDRELGQRSVAWTLEHTDRRSKDFMRGLPFDLRFDLGGQPRAARARLAAQGQRVPVRGQAGPHVRADRGRRGLRRARLRPHPPALGRASTAACCSSTAARSASPRTATRAPHSPCCELDGDRVVADIERVEYDAEAVAREVAGGRPARRVRGEAGG